MVDVGSRIGGQVRDDEIDRRLEGDLLRRAIVSPERRKPLLAVHRVNKPKEVLKAALE